MDSFHPWSPKPFESLLVSKLLFYKYMHDLLFKVQGILSRNWWMILYTLWILLCEGFVMKFQEQDMIRLKGFSMMFYDES